jgi:hypothetical protein
MPVASINFTGVNFMLLPALLVMVCVGDDKLKLNLVSCALVMYEPIIKRMAIFLIIN